MGEREEEDGGTDGREVTGREGRKVKSSRGTEGGGRRARVELGRTRDTKRANRERMI